MKVTLLLLYAIVILFSGCRSATEKDKILSSELLSVNGETIEPTSILDCTKGLAGRKIIFLIDAECPHCLFPFLSSLVSVQPSKNKLVVFSLYQNSDFFCDLIIEKAGKDFPFYIDKGNRFYHSILQSKKNQNGNVFLSEDIIVKVNPEAYY
jgi:hypothetical protein